MNRQPLTAVTDEQRAAYRRDGAVHLRGMFDRDWILRMQAACDHVIANADSYNQRKLKKNPGHISINYMSRRDPEFRAYALESPAAAIVGEVIGAREVRFYHDHIFAKEPHGEGADTPWHHDLQAWPVRGEMVPSLWLALTAAKKGASTLEFIAGSHLDPQIYWPRGTQLPRPADRIVCPDFEKSRGDPALRFIHWDVEPGDVILIHPRTLHCAQDNKATARRVALSTRWFGDDIRWWLRPECAPVPGIEAGVLREDERPGDPWFPVAWSRPTT